MDTILADNRFNLQMSTMLPAGLLLYAAGSGAGSALRAALAPVDTADAQTRVRLTLRDIHRLLLIAGQRLVGPAEAALRRQQQQQRERRVSDAGGRAPHTAASSAAIAGAHATRLQLSVPLVGQRSEPATQTARMARILWSDEAWLAAAQQLRSFPGLSAGGSGADATLFGQLLSTAALPGAHLTLQPLQLRRRTVSSLRRLQMQFTAARSALALLAGSAGSALGWPAVGLAVAPATSQPGPAAGAHDSLDTVLQAAAQVAEAQEAGALISARHVYLTAARSLAAAFDSVRRLLLPSHGEPAVGSQSTAGTGGARTDPAPTLSVTVTAQIAASLRPTSTRVDGAQQSPSGSAAAVPAAGEGLSSPHSPPVRSTAGGGHGVPAPDHTSSLRHPAASIRRAPDDSSDDDSDGGVDEDGDVAARGRWQRHAYSGLRPDQLGRLVVLLRRLNALLARMRPTIDFREWTRLAQDLRDITAGDSSLHIRLKTVERVMASKRWQ
jgi:hypothetical protein